MFDCGAIFFLLLFFFPSYSHIHGLFSHLLSRRFDELVVSIVFFFNFKLLLILHLSTFQRAFASVLVTKFRTTNTKFSLSKFTMN